MSNVFTIGKKIFSSSTHVLIIAEIGTGHNGDLNKAKELIDAAKTAGADAVKFQIVYADEILHPDTGFVALPTGIIPLYERFKSLETEPAFYAELAAYTHSQGLLFSASAFGLRSLKELAALQPAFIKIASPELNHFPLLEAAASCRIPLILSTGVSQLGDIEKALVCVTANNVQKTQCAVLHCVTAYPAPETEYNTAVIPSLSAIFDIAAGISDHSLHPFAVPLAAVFQGASIIEKHICLSRTGSGLDDPVALEPQQFLQMTQAVRAVTGKTEQELFDYAAGHGCSEALLRSIAGSGTKKLALSEKNNYGRTNRSLHYRTGLSKGTCLTADDIAILRTEKQLTAGESPEFLECFIGAVLQKPVTAGAGVRFDDIIQKGTA
ncbi:MAG: N-acetylneuraminate synthase family protein [Treponema sp.]